MHVVPLYKRTQHQVKQRGHKTHCSIAPRRLLERIVSCAESNSRYNAHAACYQWPRANVRWSGWQRSQQNVRNQQWESLRIVKDGLSMYSNWLDSPKTVMTAILLDMLRSEQRNLCYPPGTHQPDFCAGALGEVAVGRNRICDHSRRASVVLGRWASGYSGPD